MSGLKRPGPSLGAFHPPPEVLEQNRRHYDLALGIDLAVGLGLAVTFATALQFGDTPTPRFLLAWSVLLGAVWFSIAGGVILRMRERIGAATTLLAVVAAPAAVLGLALLPFSLIAVAGALSNLGQFREWAGDALAAHLPGWAASLAFLGALVPAALLTRRFGRHVLGIGIALGAVAVISVLLFGIFGGFSFRHMR